MLLRKAIEMARNGDVVMLKFLLSRILPRERGIRIDLPKMDFADDAVEVLGQITHAATEERSALPLREPLRNERTWLPST